MRWDDYGRADSWLRAITAAFGLEEKQQRGPRMPKKKKRPIGVTLALVQERKRIEREKRAETELKVLDVLRKHGPLSPSEVGEFAGIKDGYAILTAIADLGRCGMVVTEYSDPRRCWLYNATRGSTNIDAKVGDEARA